MPELPVKDVLIIDSNREMLNILELVFNNETLNCDYCTRGADALDCLDRFDYRILLVDTQVFDIESRTLIADIKKRNRQSRIISMSISPDNHNQYLLLGALNVITKPLSRTELVAAIRTYADERRRTPRKPVTLPVLADGTVNGTTVNMSSDGMLLESNVPLIENAAVDLLIGHADNGSKITAKGKVIRVTKKNSVYLSAVYFIENIAHDILDNIDLFMF